ncbi:hypothetical protein SRHO_G00179790 [Serrasalmus rhombeus]
MTILDIGLLTGFVPDTRDLKKLMGKDRYIQDFEINTELSERGSLIIYLNKVSNVVKERIVFRMHKMLKVALPQPARIAVYEYYAKAYKATLKEVKLSRSTIIHVFTIVEVLKEGSDPVQPKDQRTFLAHSQCKDKVRVKVDKDYLIMGPEPKKVEGSYRYVFGSQTWIEYWPTARESQENENNRERYKVLAGFKHLFNTFGCLI